MSESSDQSLADAQTDIAANLKLVWYELRRLSNVIEGNGKPGLAADVSNLRERMNTQEAVAATLARNKKDKEASLASFIQNWSGLAAVVLWAISIVSGWLHH